MANERTLEPDELERSDTWEEEPFAILTPKKPARAVVSVAFSRDDLARISEVARSNGMKTSEFIRVAAIERATGQANALPEPDVTMTSGGFRTSSYTAAGQSMRIRLDDEAEAETFA